MLPATVWRHAAICELYRDESSPMLVARRFHRRGISAARSEWRFSDRGVRSYHGRPACPDFCKELVSELPVVSRDTIELDEKEAWHGGRGHRRAMAELGLSFSGFSAVNLSQTRTHPPRTRLPSAFFTTPQSLSSGQLPPLRMVYGPRAYSLSAGLPMPSRSHASRSGVPGGGGTTGKRRRWSAAFKAPPAQADQRSHVICTSSH